ncbi:MAG: putative toxin-antitoxin system toxin component, PIN family [Crocosphaera sp.]
MDVLSRKKFDRYLSQEIREDFLASLWTESEIITVTDEINICRDRKDNKFLELAISGKATHIITGDKDLLELHPFRNILIFTPSQFLTYSPTIICDLVGDSFRITTRNSLFNETA